MHIKHLWSVAIFLIFCHSAVAEGVLISSTPKDNALLNSFDNKISLAFSGNVSERTPSLVVVNSSGERVDKRDATLTIAQQEHGRSLLTANTENLATGRYVTRYRVVTEDGLVVSGLLRFEIGARP